jgi:hypothetical protein
MAGKTTQFAQAILQLILNGTAIPNLAINATSAPATLLYISLHANDPGSGGQNSNEVAYTGYARVSTARTTGGWTVSAAGVASPVAAIAFPTCTGGSTTAYFFGIGLSASGAGTLLYSGPLSGFGLAISNTITPQLTTASTITES